jgi:hypothetical protein
MAKGTSENGMVCVRALRRVSSESIRQWETILNGNLRVQYVLGFNFTLNHSDFAAKITVLTLFKESIIDL